MPYGARSYQGTCVNRSQRRAAVISSAVIAAVLCGVVGAAPAQGDTADATQSGDEVGGKPRARSQSPVARPNDSIADRRTAGRAAVRESVGVPTDTGNPGEAAQWPCHLPWSVWPVPPEPFAGNPGHFVAPIAVTPPVPYPTVTERPLPAVLGLAGTAAASPADSAVLPRALPARVIPPAASASSPQASVSPGGSPRAPVSPGASPRAPVSPGSSPQGPAPLSAPSAPAAAGSGKAFTPPAAPAPRRGDGTLPTAARAGYPGYLRDADMAQVATLALSGLAGILGMTALGGFLGYRQAKVGYMVRAGGIARFLQ